MTSTFSWRREEGENWKLMEGRDKKRGMRKAGGREERFFIEKETKVKIGKKQWEVKEINAILEGQSQDGKVENEGEEGRKN